LGLLETKGDKNENTKSNKEFEKTNATNKSRKQRQDDRLKGKNSKITDKTRIHMGEEKKKKEKADEGEERPGGRNRTSIHHELIPQIGIEIPVNNVFIRLLPRGVSRVSLTDTPRVVLPPRR